MFPNAHTGMRKTNDVGGIPFATNLRMRVNFRDNTKFTISDTDKVDAVADSTSYGNDFSKAADVSRPVKVTNGITVDGTQFIENTSPDTSRNNLTVGTWFVVGKRTANNGVLYGMSYSSGSLNVDYLPVFYISGGTTLRCRFRDSQGTSTRDVDGAIVSGEWFIGTVTWNKTSGDLKMYIDGVLTDTAIVVNPTLTTMDFEVIGAAPNVGRTYKHNGGLKDVGMYNTELSAGQVAALSTYLTTYHIL